MPNFLDGSALLDVVAYDGFCSRFDTNTLMFVLIYGITMQITCIPTRIEEIHWKLPARVVNLKIGLHIALIFPFVARL